MPNPYPGWSYFAAATVTNATAGGVTNQPVPVILDAGCFTFAHAKSDGSDLRCALADGTILSFWLEHFDASAQLARLWVKVPSVSSAGTATVNVYYGNAGASSASSYDSTFAKVAAGSGIAGLWHFDEGSGTTSADTSGNNLTATLVGSPTWAGTDGGNFRDSSPAQAFSSGSAIQLSGSGQRITIDTLNTFPAAGGFAFWFKYAGTPTDYAALFRKNNASGDEVICQYTPAGGLRYFLTVGSSSIFSPSPALGIHLVPIGSWNHIAVCWGTGGFRVYLNGEIDYVDTTTSIPGPGSAFPLGIGGDPTTAGYDSPAIIDEMVLFSRQVTVDDVYALYGRRPLFSVGPQISKWSRLAGNPIVTDTGDSPEFALEPSVRKIASNDYRMWFDHNKALGYATSTDGAAWTYVGIKLGNGNGGEAAACVSPSVFSLDGGTTLICTYCNDASYGNTSLFYATSTDNGLTWTKQGAALTATATELGYFNSSFINDGGTVRGIVDYRGGDGKFHAATYSGSSITTLSKQGAATTAIEGLPLLAPDVHKVGSYYYCFYGTNRIGQDIPSLLYCARSADFANWIESGEGPVLQIAANAYEYNQVQDPFLLDDGGTTQRLFFAGSNDGSGVSGGTYRFAIEGATYSGTAAQLFTDGVSASVGAEQAAMGGTVARRNAGRSMRTGSRCSV